MAWIAGGQGDAMFHLHSKRHIKGMNELLTNIAQNSEIKRKVSESFRILISTPENQADRAISSFAALLHIHSDRVLPRHKAIETAEDIWSHHEQYRKNLERK
ncbi:MAG: hypothetical protein AABX01_05345 [Candidatus Micrarchaeota archaeon]